MPDVNKYEVAWFTLYVLAHEYNFPELCDYMDTVLNSVELEMKDGKYSD
jgi:hypothetical protein